MAQSGAAQYASGSGVQSAGESAQPSLHLALERVGGISYLGISPDGDESLGVTTFTLGGANPSPLGVPRIGVDWIAPFGLTLGGALGFSHASVASSDQNVGSGSSWVFEPRVGYRAALGKHFDLIPRLGVEVMGLGFKEGDEQWCQWDPNTQSDRCRTVEGDELSVTMVSLNAEAVGVLRLTDSYNLLIGAAVQPLLSGSAETTDFYEDDNGGVASESQSDDYNGTAIGAALWLGLSGYL